MQTSTAWQKNNRSACTQERRYDSTYETHHQERTETIDLGWAATKTTGSDTHMVLLPAVQLWLKRSL